MPSAQLPRFIFHGQEFGDLVSAPQQSRCIIAQHKLGQQASEVFANKTRERCMYTARACEATEQWIELPEPALHSYLLRSCHRAANDNRYLSVKALCTVQMVVCVALISVLSLVGALV